MPCYQPRTVWLSNEVTAKGLHKITFSAVNALENSEFKIPCRVCRGCRIDHGSGWALRLYQESKFHMYNSFLTLTYAPEHYPVDGTLVKRDLQLFMKRVRKYFSNLYPGIKIRYFAVGEYGEQTYRAHYHLIVYGVDFHEDRRLHSKNRLGQQKYVSATLTKLWGLGNCEIGSVSPDSCGYVAGYAFKKLNGQLAECHYFVRVDEITGEIIYRQREFALMSTHPGIAYKHYEQYGDADFRRGSCIYKGKQVPIPKYFDRKLKEVDPLRLESIKTGRFEDMLAKAADNTPERLAVKEEIAAAKRREYVRKDL